MTECKDKCYDSYQCDAAWDLCNTNKYSASSIIQYIYIYIYNAKDYKIIIDSLYCFIKLFNSIYPYIIDNHLDRFHSLHLTQPIHTNLM